MLRRQFLNIARCRQIVRRHQFQWLACDVYNRYCYVYGWWTDVSDYNNDGVDITEGVGVYPIWLSLHKQQQQPVGQSTGEDKTVCWFVLLALHCSRYCLYIWPSDAMKWLQRGYSVSLWFVAMDTIIAGNVTLREVLGDYQQTSSIHRWITLPIFVIAIWRHAIYMYV